MGCCAFRIGQPYFCMKAQYMKFTDVFKNVLNYSAMHFPEIVSAFASAGLFILTCFIYKYAKKAFHANTISNSRPAYIGTLRKSLSDLHVSLLNFHDESEKAKKEKKFNKVNADMWFVLYHFNEFEQMNIDKKFISFLKDNVQKDKIDAAFIEKYRKYASSILQYEWDNFKKEVVKGEKLTFGEKDKTRRETIDRAIS